MTLSITLLKRLCVIVFLLYSAPMAYAATTHHSALLPPQAIERVRQYKLLVKDVEPKSVPAIVSDLEKTGDPMLNLQIKEAIAKTYAVIIQEEHIEGISKKQWLYSMVALNMAYLQFGGTNSDRSLNKMILHKLKENLPAGIIDQHGFHFSLE